MKKRIILFFLVVLAFFVFLFNYFSYYYTKCEIRERSKLANSIILLCPPPEKEGVKICCYENNNLVDCTNKSTFNCNENIEVRIKLKPLEPSYVCINQSFSPPPPVIPTNFTFFYPEAIFTCIINSTDYGDVILPIENVIDVFLGGRIFNITGRRSIVEVFTFPVKNYTSIESLLKDIINSTKILEINKEIVC